MWIVLCPPRAFPASWAACLALVGLMVALAGCQSVYYGALEQVGIHKRDLLVSRVKDARDAQNETKEQFASALERFTQTMNFKGGKLEDAYETLRDELAESESKAERVHERIAAVEDVAGALFDEWKAELAQYSSPQLRRSSERELEATRRRYAQLIRAMHRAESRIAPVLDAFRDQVLYLKHNLNARAIASLKGELTTVETDVAALLREMEAAIAESNRFIREMEAPGSG